MQTDRDRDKHDQSVTKSNEYSRASAHLSTIPVIILTLFLTFAVFTAAGGQVTDVDGIEESKLFMSVEAADEQHQVGLVKLSLEFSDQPDVERISSFTSSGKHQDTYELEPAETAADVYCPYNQECVVKAINASGGVVDEITIQTKDNKFSILT